MAKRGETKFTRDFVLNEVAILFDILKENENIRSITKLLLERNKQLDKDNYYAIRRWYDWKRSFFDDEEISGLIDLIEGTVEERVADGCLTGDLNAPFGKLTMVNRHGWTEKSELNANINGNISLSQLAKEVDDDEEEDPE